jgi:cellulose synthase/poly-beta-1,6-N-acetylglucosamine synthase-like glycosyltransferase
MGLTIATIVCAYNESRLLPGCLYSLRAQTRPPDDILVIDNASTDETGAVARAVPGVRVLDEPCKGLVVARDGAPRSPRRHVALPSGRRARAAVEAAAGAMALQIAPRLMRGAYLRLRPSV